MEPTIVIDAGHGGYQLRKDRKGKTTVSIQKVKDIGKCSCIHLLYIGWQRAVTAFWHVSSGEINVFSWMCIVKKYFMKYNKTIKVRGGRLWKVS